MKRYVYLLIGLLIFLGGCRKQPPQLPAHRMGEGPKVDSVQMRLMELNSEMAQAADAQLTKLVQQQEDSYALYDGNVWIHFIERGDIKSPAPAEDEEWLIHLRIYTLEGRLLQDAEQTYRIGKRELPPAVDYNIGDMHRGTQARMYVPWYSAYGLQGTEEVPSYENVIIEMEIK